MDRETIVNTFTGDPDTVIRRTEEIPLAHVVNEKDTLTTMTRIVGEVCMDAFLKGWRTFEVWTDARPDARQFTIVVFVQVRRLPDPLQGVRP